MFNLKLFIRHLIATVIIPSSSEEKRSLKHYGKALLFISGYIFQQILNHSGLLLDNILFPAYKKAGIIKPIFIIGNFRSGSTFLHRLLSYDHNNFTALKTWEIYLAPSITQRKIVKLILFFDKLAGHPIRKIIDRLEKRSLHTVKIHSIALRQPEEDEGLLLHTWNSIFCYFMLPFIKGNPAFQYFDEQLPEQKRLKIMKFYKKCIQRHLYLNPGKKLISKNPSFSPKTETLLKIFPDAKFIYLARDPQEMLPSVTSWFSFAWHFFGNPKTDFPHKDFIIKMTKYWYLYPLDNLKALPQNQQIIFSYNKIIFQPRLSIKKIYKQFELALNDNFLKIVLETEKKYKDFKKEHIYSAQAQGYSQKQIQKDYKEVYRLFDFNK